jgi:predicted transcriptional regulator of viral defense system
MKLLKKLKEIDKLYYTTNDIRKVEKYTVDSLYVILSRLVNNGELIRLASGIYILPERYGEIETIANLLYTPSYLSFESALSKYGILSQIPYTLSFATTRKSRKKTLGSYPVEYRQLQSGLFFEFTQTNNGIFIASPEKALFDTLYLSVIGKLSIDFSSLDMHSVNIKRVLRYTRKYLKKYETKVKKVLVE